MGSHAYHVVITFRKAGSQASVKRWPQWVVNQSRNDLTDPKEPVSLVLGYEVTTLSLTASRVLAVKLNMQTYRDATSAGNSVMRLSEPFLLSDALRSA